MVFNIPEGGSVIDEFFVKHVELIDDSKFAAQRKQWWDYVRRFMSNQFQAKIIFGEKQENVGGYFTSDAVKFDCICVPMDSAEVHIEYNGSTPIGGSIKFNDDEAFATFLHEVSHYMHFVRDNGKYTAPCLEDKAPAIFTNESGFSSNMIGDLEYEAGYRSLITNRMFNLFPEGDRTVLENNLLNMSHYVIITNRQELNDMSEKEVLKRIKAWAKTCPNFTSISNFEITI